MRNKNSTTKILSLDINVKKRKLYWLEFNILSQKWSMAIKKLNHDLSLPIFSTFQFNSNFFYSVNYLPKPQSKIHCQSSNTFRILFGYLLLFHRRIVSLSLKEQDNQDQIWNMHQKSLFSQFLKNFNHSYRHKLVLVLHQLH